VLTVDTAVWGRREADVRNNFTLPDGLIVANLAAHANENFPDGLAGSGLAADGEEGAYRLLELLKAEFDLAMVLYGARTVGEIDRLLVM
jgi:isopentenyl diphosphate isomerase/L-lactate dehydrogenase-like FMN-dependent dehydrogenase